MLASIQSINQASINPRIRAHQSINSIQRVQNIQSIKLGLLGLIDWLIASLLPLSLWMASFGNPKESVSSDHGLHWSWHGRWGRISIYGSQQKTSHPNDVISETAMFRLTTQPPFLMFWAYFIAALRVALFVEEGREPASFWQIHTAIRRKIGDCGVRERINLPNDRHCYIYVWRWR